RRHTRSDRDWSSDVCSSDLPAITDADANFNGSGYVPPQGLAITAVDDTNGTWQYSQDSGATWTDIPAVSDTLALLLEADSQSPRSEERRVGKEGGARRVCAT